MYGYLAPHEPPCNAAFKLHLNEPGWFKGTHRTSRKLKVAYFSAEFGLQRVAADLFGGLGVLAGDHLKSASELGIPLVAIGLLYRNGYFQQYLSHDGWQQEAYPELDFYNLAVEQQRYTDGSPVRVRVDLPDNAVLLQVWRVSVGRIPLYLLDTNLQENSPVDREITSRLLFGGGNGNANQAGKIVWHRRNAALDGARIVPTVFHMNEGHSAFFGAGAHSRSAGEASQSDVRRKFAKA